MVTYIPPPIKYTITVAKVSTSLSEKTKNKLFIDIQTTTIILYTKRLKSKAHRRSPRHLITITT